MDDDIRKLLREHAWSYFVLHAEQRLKMFHFFIILSAVISGGLVTIAKEGGSLGGAFAFALLLPFLSFIFWKLDKRTKQLINHAEEALKSLERDSDIPGENDEPHRLKLFLHEEHVTSKLVRLPHAPWSAHFSYSTCFNAVFLFFGLAGSVAVVILLLMMIQPSSEPVAHSPWFYWG